MLTRFKKKMKASNQKLLLEKKILNFEPSRLAISQDETLNILRFYGKSYDDLRQQADKSLQQLWSRLNVLSKRVEEIGKSIELIQRYSYQYNVKIVGLPEIKASESASDTTTQCLSL